MSNLNVEQTHPQDKKGSDYGRPSVKGTVEPSDREFGGASPPDYSLSVDFPGARDIQRDLQTALNSWGLTEDELYTKTRAIHATGTVYRRTATGEQQDWT